MTQAMKFTLMTVWVLGPSKNIRDAIGVFATEAMARDFHKWEENSNPNFEVLQYDVLRVDDGPDAKSVRVFFLGSGPYELSTDYTSEETQRRQALRASARSKLTLEECMALGLSPSG